MPAAALVCEGCVAGEAERRLLGRDSLASHVALLPLPQVISQVGIWLAELHKGCGASPGGTPQGTLREREGRELESAVVQHEKLMEHARISLSETIRRGQEIAQVRLLCVHEDQLR